MSTKRDKPQNCYVFVDIQEKQLVMEEDGTYSYWEKEEDILLAVQQIREKVPTFNFDRYGIAYITFTYTEFEEGRELEYMNIDVKYHFTN